MNKMISKFLLTRDKFMPELHFLLIVLVDHLQNIMKEFKNVETGNSKNIYTEIN